QTRMLLVRILGIGAAIATGNAAAAVAGDQLVLRSLLAERRSQEAAADQAGLQYLNATAQSGRGMVETFERFAQQEFISDSYKDANIDRIYRRERIAGTNRQLNFAQIQTKSGQLKHITGSVFISGIESHLFPTPAGSCSNS
ncbi:MAG: hypothetical protein AAFR97_08515, partial [Bacteroidota bacterium]